MWRIGSVIVRARQEFLSADSGERGDGDAAMDVDVCAATGDDVDRQRQLQAGVRAFLAHYMEYMSSRPFEPCEALPNVEGEGKGEGEGEGMSGDSGDSGDSGVLSATTTNASGIALDDPADADLSDIMADEEAVRRWLTQAFHAVPHPVQRLPLPPPAVDEALSRDTKRLYGDIDVLIGDQRLLSVAASLARLPLQTLRHYSSSVGPAAAPLPGPRLTIATPGRPVSRPSATAMNPAPPSWRHVTTSICGKSTSASSRPR